METQRLWALILPCKELTPLPCSSSLSVYGLAISAHSRMEDGSQMTTAPYSLPFSAGDNLQFPRISLSQVHISEVNEWVTAI